MKTTQYFICCWHYKSIKSFPSSLCLCDTVSRELKLSQPTTYGSILSRTFSENKIKTTSTNIWECKMWYSRQHGECCITLTDIINIVHCRVWLSPQIVYTGHWQNDKLCHNWAMCLSWAECWNVGWHGDRECHGMWYQCQVPCSTLTLVTAWPLLTLVTLLLHWWLENVSLIISRIYSLLTLITISSYLLTLAT